MSFLVYGDAAHEVQTKDALAVLAARLSAVRRLPAGLERHAGLVAALIEAGQIAQGLADAATAAAGVDEISCTEQAAMRLVMAIAEAVGRSYENAFAQGDAAGSWTALRQLEKVGGPENVTVKQPEGYAFYALYPEGFFAAALPLRESGAWRAVGLRSIGTSLSAMVAAGLGAPPPLTVRPVGHPFQRRIAAGPKLSGRLPGAPGEKIALVDEGPGLSGSSFGALADFLEEQGVSRERLHVFPGHAGDLGPQASAAHRARWTALPRHVAGFEALWLRGDDPRHLARWFEDLVGSAEAPLEDISGGAWRRLAHHSEADWPAADVNQERRKFLLRAGGKTWLLKFGGLGHEGERKIGMARALASAGFSPPVAGFRHGFRIEAWLSDGRPLSGMPADRAGFLDHLANYLAFRAKSFPAERAGASLETLFEMARFNAEQALGASAAAALDGWQRQLPALQATVRPILIDGRLHPHEWLEMPDGRLLKTDAVDHHAAHDLVGCQDVAWDIAGAALEFSLSPAEAETLRERTEFSLDAAVPPQLVAFFQRAYPAFQLGRSALAASALNGLAEQRRLGAEAARYAEMLQRAFP